MVRRRLLEHVPALAAFAVMMLVAGSMAYALDPGAPGAAQAISPGTAVPVALPSPEDDQDRDGYADDVDPWDGNAQVRIEIESLTADDDVYVLVGTDDDHWRFGSGRELQWRHVVDPDPLGMNPGSPEWAEEALRTGTWLVSTVDGDVGFGTNWTAWLDVRDDQTEATVKLEVWKQRFGPDTKLAAWDLFVDALEVRVRDGAGVAHGASFALSAGGVEATVRVGHAMDMARETKVAIADKWAPVIHFDSEESFFPTDPALMEQFHGFSKRLPDLQTWARSFNNGRDGYRLLVADFDGNRLTDHNDVHLLWDILRAGTNSDRVHAHVAMTEGDQVVVQYWLIYPYNFVVGEDGRDVAALAHAGDREFVQFLFPSVAEALNGTPSSVAYSQHYKGIRFDDPDLTGAPFVDGRLQIYPARGSHASYPAPGDDSRLRNAFIGYGDQFDGAGITWAPGDYNVTLLESQPWHQGYKWGPLTRFHRDLGSAGRPLLAHTFVYPWHEPVRWAESLDAVTPEELTDLYGGAP